MSLVECLIFVFQLSFLTLGKASSHRKLVGFLDSVINLLPVRCTKGIAVCKQMHKNLLTRYTNHAASPTLDSWDHPHHDEMVISFKFHPLTFIPYSGKLSRVKTFANWWKYNFCGENFRRLLACAAPKVATHPNFAEKTFANSHKTAKFMKVFSLESFPLYGMVSSLWECVKMENHHHVWCTRR